ncbi:MAG: AMP-binding protein, partial [Planctomycetota bacterium]|nr:AMP-binding protein [Planctomycetota bacterium]
MEHVLEQTARRLPERLALVVGEDSRTWSALEQEVADFAAGLAARGVRAGECVALALDNSIEACVAILGCLRLGAVFVCLNPTIKEDKLRALLEHSTAVAFITDVPHLELMQGGRGYMPNLCVVVGA